METTVLWELLEQVREERRSHSAERARITSRKSDFDLVQAIYAELGKLDDDESDELYWLFGELMLRRAPDLELASYLIRLDPDDQTQNFEGAVERDGERIAARAIQLLVDVEAER